MIYSEACGKTIDITLEYQTKPLLEMQQKLAESEEENTEENENNEKVEVSQDSVKAESQQSTFCVSFSVVV